MDREVVQPALRTGDEFTMLACGGGLGHRILQRGQVAGVVVTFAVTFSRLPIVPETAGE